MKILESHKHKLRFRLDKCAPPKWVSRWNELKKQCESGDNKDIVNEIKQFCKLETNKNLPYLDRVEGGMGGNCNKRNKQMRFRMYIGETDRNWKRDNDIVFSQIYNTEHEHWTYEELDDIIHGFVNMANSRLNETCVYGCIEMENIDYHGEDEWKEED